jgi:hypothetical protein
MAMKFRYSASQILEKKWEYNTTVYQLFTDFEEAYDSVRKKVLYNILTEFCTPMELVRLIKMYLNITYSNVCIGKYLSNVFPVENDLKQKKNALLHTMHTMFWSENLKGRDHSEGLGIHRRIILEWFLREIGWKVVDWHHLVQDRVQW